MTKFGNKIRIETYISEDVYNRINEERQAENGSLSGFVASVLEDVFGGETGRIPNDL